MAIKLKEPLDVEVKQPASQAQQTVDQTPAQEAPTVSASKSSNTAGTRTATTSGPATTSAKNSTGFVSSPALEQAYALLQQQQANKPGNYTPIWQDEADAYLSQYENRGHFAYDVTKDALYNQYKDIYVNQGQLASMDVMGQAAAMTGGYGNSYVQSVGQQAYNQYLSQLNAVVPELHQMAHDRYTQDGQQLLNMYDLYLNRENQEYAKHQDSLDRWYKEVARLQSDYDSQYAKEYAKYRDDVADQKWLKSFNRSSSGGGGGGKFKVDLSSEDYDRLAKYKKNGQYEEAADYIDFLEQAHKIDSATADSLYETYGLSQKTGDSDAVKNFMSSLPYAHAGSDPNVWKNYVRERLNKSSLTDAEKSEVKNKLGL
jgi:hypothetical protein